MLWLGRWFLNGTFDQEVECDIKEIRQLIDGVTSDPSNAIVPIDEGEAK